MSKFKITRKIELKFIGEEWKDCYLEFEPITIKETKQYMDIEDEKEVGLKAIELLKQKFISGKAIIEDGTTIDVKKDELEDFPSFVLVEVMSFLSTGQLTTK